MAVCPNKESAQWKELSKAVGGDGAALAAFVLNDYEFPTIDVAKTLLDANKGGKVKFSEEAAQALKDKKLARVDEQLESMDRIIKSSPKDARQPALQLLKNNLEEYKKAIENDEYTVSVSNFLGGGQLDSIHDYRNYQEFGTFVHHILEVMQKENLGNTKSMSSVYTKEKLQEIFDNYDKEFTINGLVENGKIVKMDELYNMTNDIVASVQHYVSLGHTILPEISVISKDRQGRNIVGRLDIVTISRTGKVNILDIKTKMIDASKGFDSLTKAYPVNSSNKTDGLFKGGVRNTYQNWDLQLGVYARMLERLGLKVDEKVILKLLYAGDYLSDNGQQFDQLGNDTYQYSFFKVETYKSSEHNMPSEFDEQVYKKNMDNIRQAIPIEGETKQAKKEEDKSSFIYNLSAEDATLMLDKLKDITESHLQNSLKELKKHEKEGNQSLVDYFTHRIRALTNIKSSLTTNNKEWQAAHKIGFILNSLQIDMEGLAKAAVGIKINAKTNEEFLAQAKILERLNNMANGYNFFLEDIKKMLIDHVEISDKNDEMNKIVNNIQDNIRQVAQVYTKLGFNFTIGMLKDVISDSQQERITEQRKEAIEPILKFLKGKRDKLASGEKGIGLWNRLTNSAFKGSVTPQNQIEKLDFEIAKLEAELSGIKFDDKGLETYIYSILDPKSQLYIGDGTTFFTKYIASTSSADLLLSSFANHLKIALSEGTSEFVNFVEREGLEEEFNEFKQFETNTTELNERLSEVRKTLSYDENGNEKITETRAFADPIAEKYHNIFVSHYQVLHEINQKILKATDAAEIDALRKEKADEINRHLEWRLANSQMKLVDELYELDKMLPADYKEKRDELYREKNDLEQSAGFNNSEQLDESVQFRVAQIEVELNKLRKEYAEKNGNYQKYMDLIDKYYDYDINYNYFERLKSQKMAELRDANGLLDQEAFDKWMTQNTIKRANQDWYDAVGDIWDRIFSIIGKQNPNVEELNQKYKEILSQYKRKGIVDSRFFSVEDKATLNEIEDLIIKYKTEGAGGTKLSSEERRDLKNLFQELEALQTKVNNPYYVKEFNIRIDSLDQKWNRYQQETDTEEKDRALEQFLLEEMEFKTWFDDNHENTYESRMMSDEGITPLPKKYNILTVPSSEDMYDVKPDHKFTIRKLKEEAYNKDYQEDIHGYPMPKGLTREGARVMGNSEWLNPKYVQIRNNARDAKFYNSFVTRYLEFQEKTTGRGLGYNFPGYEQTSIDQYMNEGILTGVRNRLKLFKDKHIAIGSEYDWGVNNYRGSTEDRVQFKHNTTLPLEEQTRDGIGAVIRWYEDAHVNKAMSDVQPMAKSVINFAENLYKILSDSDLKDKEARKKALRDVIDQMIFEYDKFVRGKVKVGENAYTKFGDLCLRGIGFTRLGLDLPNQIGNLLSGNVQAFLGSHRSGLYSSKNYLWAKTKIESKDGLVGSLLRDYAKIGNKSFMTKMLLYFNPQQKSLEHYYNRTRSTGQRLAQGFIEMNPAFFLQDKGELEISSTIWLSIMDNIKVKVVESRNEDGSVKEYAKDANGNIKTVNAFEAYKENDRGEIVVRDDVEWSKKDEAAAKKAVWSEIRRTNGRYAEWDKAKIESGFTGRLLLYYRKYLEPSIRNRIGRRESNWEAGEIAYGFYSALIKAIQTEGAWNVAKSIFGASEKNTGVNEYYQRKSQMAARELLVATCLYILGLTIKGAVPKGKKDDDLIVGHNILMNLIAIYGKVDNETRSLVPVSIIGGLDGYIQSMGEFTNANRDFLKVATALKHSLFLIASIFTDSKYVDQQARYQVTSGNFKKGDTKLMKDLMDLTGYMNVYEMFYPTARVKNSFLTKR